MSFGSFYTLRFPWSYGGKQKQQHGQGIAPSSSHRKEWTAIQEAKQERARRREARTSCHGCHNPRLDHAGNQPSFSFTVSGFMLEFLGTTRNTTLPTRGRTNRRLLPCRCTCKESRKSRGTQTCARCFPSHLLIALQIIEVYLQGLMTWEGTMAIERSNRTNHWKTSVTWRYTTAIWTHYDQLRLVFGGFNVA